MANLTVSVRSDLSYVNWFNQRRAVNFGVRVLEYRMTQPKSRNVASKVSATTDECKRNTYLLVGDEAPSYRVRFA